jgi:hypothetical protein
MAWIAALIGALLTVASSMVGRVLLALGMSYVTYKGFDVGITWLLDRIKENMSSMPADMVSFLGWLWVDKAISMVFSAYSVALALKMAGGTSFTKIVTKKP